MPSSSLVEVEVGVEVGVGGGWGFRSRVRSTYQKLDPQMKSNLTFSVGWVVGVEIWRVKQSSTQVEVEVGVELGKMHHTIFHQMN